MICIPIVESRLEDILIDISNANKFADLIELRVDCFEKNIDLIKIFSACKKPIVFTIRTLKDKGNFSGYEDEREKLFNIAIENNIDYIDVEHGTELSEKLLKSKSKSQIILSYHNFNETNKKELTNIYKRMKKQKPDFVKIVSYANNINDNIIIYDLLKQSKKDNQKIISFCMGTFGQSSRILSMKFGSKWTFCALGDKKTSAAGQINYDEMINLYQINKLNEETKIFGLVGNPVNKSKGYLMHNKVFKENNINAIYVNFLVEDFQVFMKANNDLLSGISITMPFKLEASDYVKSEISAINTINFTDKKPVGYNTDTSAILELIKTHTDSEKKKILIIGAGGVAQGLVEEISKDHDIIITNRTQPKANKIAKQYGCQELNFSELNTFKDFNILINTTSVGMSPNISNSLISNIEILRNKIVMDTIYNPEITKLLQDAKSVNAKTITGVDMFVYQGMKQQKIWNNLDLDFEHTKSMVVDRDD